jgi:hypothetical protein
VSYNPDDLGFYIKPGDVDALSNWVLIGEVCPRENIIDVDHNRSMFIVLFADKAAAFECNTHRLFESGFNQVKTSIEACRYCWLVLAGP